MNCCRDERGADCFGTAQTTGHCCARAPLPWPGTSCVSSPCANRAGTHAAAPPYSTALRGAARVLQAPPVQSRVTTAGSLQYNHSPYPPTCNIAEGEENTTRMSGSSAASAPHAEKGNSPSPELAPLRTRAAEAHRTMPDTGMPAGQAGAAHTEAALEQPLQQGGNTQTDIIMQEASAAGVALVPAAKQALRAAQVCAVQRPFGLLLPG
jgi:hypothetical protein